jgi:hypothetical protein
VGQPRGITQVVKDINPKLTVVNGKLFFTAYDDINGYQL